MTWTCAGCAPRRDAGNPEHCPRCCGFTTIATAVRVRPAVVLERKRAHGRLLRKLNPTRRIR